MLLAQCSACLVLTHHKFCACVMMCEACELIFLCYDAKHTQQALLAKCSARRKGAKHLVGKRNILFVGVAGIEPATIRLKAQSSAN